MTEYETQSLELAKQQVELLKQIASAKPAPRAAPKAATNGEPVFPPYGKNAGAPILGASIQDLEFYANGARRSLGDPSKERFHDKERALLGAIEAEIARQIEAEIARQGGASDAPPPIGEAW